MVATNNGYSSVNGITGTKLIRVGLHVTRVRKGDTGTVLSWLARQIHADVERCTSIYGWRSPATNARVGGTWDSNHMSGTAIDYNGAKHPYEVTRPHNWDDGWSGLAVEKIHEIMRACSGVVTWGNDLSERYHRGTRDAMHFEIRASAAAVARAADKLRGGTVTVKETVNGRDKPSVSKGKVIRVRKAGYRLTYDQVLYREGRVWLRTEHKTYYAAEFTSF